MHGWDGEYQGQFTSNLLGKTVCGNDFEVILKAKKELDVQDHGRKELWRHEERRTNMFHNIETSVSKNTADFFFTSA